MIKRYWAKFVKAMELSARRRAAQELVRLGYSQEEIKEALSA